MRPCLALTIGPERPLCSAEDRRQVCLDDASPALLGHAQEQGVIGDPGATHEHLYRSETLLDLGERGLDLAGAVTSQLTAKSSCEPGGPSQVLGRLGPPGDRHPVAAGLEPARAGQADAARATGDEDDPRRRGLDLVFVIQAPLGRLRGVIDAPPQRTTALAQVMPAPKPEKARGRRH